MKRALLIFVKDGMTEKDVEAVARSQAKKMFGWETASVADIVDTKVPSEKVAVVDKGDVLNRLWNFVETGKT